MVLIVILYALWAASISSSKVLLTYTSPIFLTGIRMFISGIILLAYQYFYAREQFTFKREHIKLYAQIIVFGILISYFLRFWALEYISASKLMFLYNLAPFISAIYSYFAFSEIITRMQWVGMSVGFLGLIPILMTSSAQESSLGEFFFMSWQELAVILSVATNSYSWIVMRKLVRDNNYSPMMINGICMFTGGVIALGISFIVEKIEHVYPMTMDQILPFFGLLGFIIVISNIVSHNLYAYLLRTYTATFLSFAGFLGPLFAAIYGWLFFKETITWHFYVASVIVFIGLYLFYKDELRSSDSLIEQ